MECERLVDPKAQILRFAKGDRATTVERNRVLFTDARDLRLHLIRVDAVGCFTRQAEQDRPVRPMAATGKRQRSVEVDDDAARGVEQLAIRERVHEATSGAHRTDRVRAGRSDPDFEEIESADEHGRSSGSPERQVSRFLKCLSDATSGAACAAAHAGSMLVHCFANKQTQKPRLSHPSVVARRGVRPATPPLLAGARNASVSEFAHLRSSTLGSADCTPGTVMELHRTSARWLTMMTLGAAIFSADHAIALESGWSAYERGHFAEAFVIFDRDAERGDRLAQFNAAMMLIRGESAARRLRRAASSS